MAADDGAPQNVTTAPVLPGLHCGFWSRVLALFIDWVILGLFGLCLGALFGSQFCDLWPWGRLLIGYPVALLYFGTLSSSLGAGQSLGKKALKIRVVNRQGVCISPARSLLRAMILETPIFLNQDWPPSIAGSFVGMALNLLVLAAGGSVLYLYVFNRGTRQSLHDLVAGTYVVRVSAQGPVVVPPIARVHYGIIAAWVLVVLAFVGSGSPWLLRHTEFGDIVALQRTLDATNKTHLSGVTDQVVFRPDGSTRTLTITALWRTEPGSYAEAANEVASVVVHQYPRVNQADRLLIRVIRGYDIGIARAWSGEWFASSPAQWRARLGTK